MLLLRGIFLLKRLRGTRENNNSFGFGQCQDFKNPENPESFAARARVSVGRGKRSEQSHSRPVKSLKLQ